MMVISNMPFSAMKTGIIPLDNEPKSALFVLEDNLCIVVRVGMT